MTLLATLLVKRGYLQSEVTCKARLCILNLQVLNLIKKYIKLVYYLTFLDKYY